MGRHENRRALIGMSGGVDSSVAAWLMREQGYECAGVTLELTGRLDARDAQGVAQLLDMPHYIYNFEHDFKEQVVDKFVSAYISGSTPNPCVDCNKFVKFRKMLECADVLGCGYAATGHYARVCESGGRWLLKKGLDAGKDQSYVLYNLTQGQLSRVKFPLGGLSKAAVREIAVAQGFANAGKRESQDICFIPDGDYAAYIEKYTGMSFPEGDFADTDGNILGRHRGIIRYTGGQRRGLGVAHKEPLYVKAKDAGANVVTLCTERGLYSRSLIARDINLIACDKIGGRLRVNARARYNQREQPATVEQTGTDELRVEFDEPQRALTGGQSVVLYDGDIIIGGGTIA